MSGSYYTTKRGADDWIISGRRHHLQIVRTEAPSGREDRHGQDVLQTIYVVKDHADAVDLSDQFEIEPHGFTRLKDAVGYAIDKLKEYDERVDPLKRRSPMGDHRSEGQHMNDEDLKILLASHERQLAQMQRDILRDVGLRLKPACQDMRDIIALVISGERSPEELAHFWNYLNRRIAEISPVADNPL